MVRACLFMFAFQLALMIFSQQVKNYCIIIIIIIITTIIINNILVINFVQGIYVKQTMFLQYTVLQLFCVYSLCCT
jgi:hypothetical protein